MLRDATMSGVPGKLEFFDAWTLKCCHGAGIKLSIPKEIFDGTGTRYQEFLNKPFWFTSKPDKAAPHGLIDVDFLLRIAAGWGSLEDVQLLVREHGATVNSRDVHGETALLKASRAGHLRIVRYLIMEAGAMANIGSLKNVTPLHWLGSFPKEHVAEVARLLFSAYGDPNAVMQEEFGGSEGEFWFFKGTPLMRVVASGNLPAVNALLNIGANPLIPRIGVPEETPLVFAVGRARVDILKALVGSVTKGLLWKRNSSGYRLISHLLMASPAYLSKVHVDRFEEALVETFDYMWSLVDPETRQFLSIDRAGHIAIQLAVTGGNFTLVKCIIDTCPSVGHLKELVATIGMQTAIVEGRYAIFKYLLDIGGLALHPVLPLEMDHDSQFETYVTCGPWTQDLVISQLRTNSLHLCAKAGEYSRMMCEDLLRSILPASR
jgi:ankyrin repeat protein